MPCSWIEIICFYDVSTIQIINKYDRIPVAIQMTFCITGEVDSHIYGEVKKKAVITKTILRNQKEVEERKIPSFKIYLIWVYKELNQGIGQNEKTWSSPPPTTT